MNSMRTGIKKAKPELSQCLMQSNTENNWKKRNETDAPILTLYAVTERVI